MKSYKQLLEDIQPGYAPSEITYRGYTTKNLHHVPDAAKAFQATIIRVEKGLLQDNGEVLQALKDTDAYMKLNDMHLEQEKFLDSEELKQWLAAHEDAKRALASIGEFEHHYDYWNAHNAELQFLKANQNMPQEAESVQIEEGPYSSGQLKASPEQLKQASKVPSGGRTTTIVDRDAKGVYTLTMKDGKEVSKVYRESIEIDEALDFKKEAAKHMKDMHDKNATPAGKAYSQKMLRRALEASKMKDKAAATKHYMGEEVELGEASGTKRPPNFTMHPIDRQDYKILRTPKKTPPKDSKEWGADGGEKKIKEEVSKLQGTPVVSLSDFGSKDYTKNKYGQTVPKKLKPNDPRVKMYTEPKKEGVKEEVESVEEGSIIKSIKRALHGWDKKAVGPGGEKLGDPRDIVKRAKAMDTDTAKKVRAGLDGASDHSPAGLQKRVLDRKLKNVKEGLADDFLKMAKEKNPNARIVTAVQKRKETEELMKKREASGTKPEHAPATGNPRPLGGYDPKSNRSYSESVELEEAELDEGDELGIRMGSSGPGFNKTPAGKAREVKRKQEHLKGQMKFTKSQGGISGPMGKLPEEVELDEEQIDELSKKTLGSYIKKRSNDVATQGAITRAHAVASERAKQSQNYTQARKSDDASNKAFQKGWKHRQNIAKAVDRLTKEEVELDEKTLTPAELKKREEIAKAMERKNPSMDKSRKMAIATAVAKRVAEQYDDAE